MKQSIAEQVILDVLRRQKTAMTRDDIVAIARTMYKGGMGPLYSALAELVTVGSVVVVREYTYRIKEADHADNT